MTVVWWVLLGFYVLLVLRWLTGHYELSQAQRHGLLKPIDHPDPQCPRSAVSVIIAAHNEAGTIATCLNRVLAQEYPALEILVANDRSTDSTGAIVRDFAGRHPNIRCVDIHELPPGWLGKTHAVSVASEQATGEFLLFLDSDVEIQPGTLDAVMERVHRQSLDFLSLWPKVVLVGFWERFLLPALGWALGLWFPNPHPDRIESTPVFANGQFLMIRRQAYQQMGGHAAVPDEMAEDVSLARIAKSQGLKRYMGLGGNLLKTRMYENINQIFHGWTRIFIGTLVKAWKLILTLVGVLIGVMPPFFILAGLIPLLGTSGSWTPERWVWFAGAIVHLIAIYSVAYRYFRMAYQGRSHLALFPVALLGVGAILVYCVVLIWGFGTIRWGNMRYQVHGSRVVRGTKSDR